MTWQDVLAANERGVLVESRRVVLDPPPPSEVPMAALMGDSYNDTEKALTAAALTVTAMALLEIVLLAGPAFAVGARRSRRQLGLVGSCGGSRARSEPWCSRAARYSAQWARWSGSAPGSV